MHHITRLPLGNGLLDQPAVLVFLAAAGLGRRSHAAKTASTAESTKVTAQTQPSGEAVP